LNLDIDRVRGLLGQWQTEPTCAGLLARDLSLAMAGTHLRAGHDVVVPQYVARVEFLRRLEQVAAEAGAQFHELMLADGKDSSVRRFLVRADSTGLAVHREAHDMLDRAGGRPRLERMYDRLQDILTVRPGTRVVPSIAGQINDTYQALVQHLAAIPPGDARLT
jgi:hypothetical protein